MALWWRKGGLGRKPAAAGSTSAPSGDGGRGFANFFRGLEQKKDLVRFFKRSKEWVSYTLHGQDAIDISREFYRTSAAVSSSSDLPSVTVSVRLASAIIPALLAANKRVEVWELQNGRWKVCGSASPGNMEGVLGENVPTDSMDGGLEEASADAVMMSVCTKTSPAGQWAGGTVGVAYANSTFRVLGVMEIEDGVELKVLESVAVQVGAREGLVEEGTGGGKAVANILEQCGILVTPQPRGAFRTPAEDVLKDTALLARADGASVVLLAEAAELPHALGALAALVRHLGLAGDVSQHHTFAFSVGHAEKYMHYDAAVAKALNVFPAPRGSRTAALLAQQPGEAAVAAGERGSGGHGGRGGEGEEGEEGDDGSGGDGSGAAGASAAAGAGAAMFTPSLQAGDVSLLSLLSAKCTPMGTRRLKLWLQHPLVSVDELYTRQAMVGFFAKKHTLRKTLSTDHKFVRGLSDLETATHKFVRRPVKATLATMLIVYRAVERTAAVASAIEAAIRDEDEKAADGGGSSGGGSRGGNNGCSSGYGGASPGPALGEMPEPLEGSEGSEDPRKSSARVLQESFVEPLRKHVKDLEMFRALCEEVVDVDAISRSGGRLVQVRPTFTEELERLHGEEAEAARAMQDVLREVTLAVGAKAAGKVRLEHNAVHGDHLRVTKRDQGLLKKVPGTRVLSVQKAGVLFTTDELRRVALRAQRLRQQYTEAAAEVEAQAIQTASTYAHVMTAAAQVLSELDAVLGLASAAAEWDWCAPTLLPPGSQTFRLRGLRHPCVEASVGRSAFIPNDLGVSEMGRLGIVTGPNCGGKSTFIRSVGTACLLAQIGSFVPADEAVLSVVDCILARVGASDNQLKGVSTFMAEMLDTAAILRCATRSSLVIVDELGRGTSSEDGFGIAWAVACRLAPIGCVSLFATHFHELVALEREPGVAVQNLHVTARVEHGSLTMLYRVEKGGCDKSFGIHVARIAGFPPEVVAEAERLAAALEAGTAHLAGSDDGSSDNGGKYGESIAPGDGGSRGNGDGGEEPPAKRAKRMEDVNGRRNGAGNAGGNTAGKGPPAVAAANSRMPADFVRRLEEMPLDGEAFDPPRNPTEVLEEVLRTFRDCGGVIQS